MLKSYAVAPSLTLAATAPAFAEEAMERASPEEATKVSEAIAKVGCKATEIAKEGDDLFEIDDAVC